MPADRAAFLRCLIALVALSVGSVALISAASRDSRHIVVMVRATPTPALASIARQP
jgi:hypothetical protein